MKVSSVLTALVTLLPLINALPTKSSLAETAKSIFERQASCTDITCIKDTDCYGNRCGNCNVDIGYCTCPPEAEGGPC
ncbi:hypothetical protein CC77DRAFT_1018038 [Alternaria alternata]|uniref:Uncharacterized protein n=2 Tax=Alternaria alternata complex TaxID=187734 RepID=A0A177DVL3_ALTAL|nr:hypothetical protein CC77DRAFT_1018038 [Alternaria alternata]RYN45816.1 hypothetical protein AA0114_g8728 [Alternaria tenuissima]OAG23211.1 hypothetical protein CC77DRAFT_1018038 [Alternaria alternata]RYN52532.1 hypothetical protein AA0118_g9968 [Alternaria tenuissima]RYN64972.1 hypothetical protein AA0117_g12293 [Alternaria alternata]RYN98155.1 hypothetical protein AA0120_g2393 [Alternaria tenuissima]